MWSAIFSRQRGRIAGSIALVLLLGVFGYAGYMAYQYKQMTKRWYQPLGEERTEISQPGTAGAKTPSPAPPAAEPPVIPRVKPLKPFTLLLIGTDSRDGERARADTMMLAVLRPASQQVYLLSIPRDSYMNLPGKGFDKVNHALAFGGTPLLKASLEGFFQVKIDRYVTIDFDGFRKLIDELGGVEIEVKKRMKYTDPTDDTYIDLHPGRQVLNGEQALDYARYRKSDLGREDSDMERVQRQQEIVQALAQKGESLQTYLKAFRLIEILGDHVKTDLSEAEITSLLAAYHDNLQNRLVTDTLMGTDERIWRQGVRGWYYLIPKTEQQRVQQRLQAELSGQQP